MPNKLSLARWTLGAVIVLAGGLGAGCAPPVPANPTYAADVRPIFMSRCVRCHGAGGMLNNEHLTTGLDAGVNAPGRFLASSNGYFDHYEDQGTCTVTNNVLTTPRPGCMAGAHTMATITTGTASLGGRVNATSARMPPLPAPPLDDWELKVVNAWVANPICDTTANPDPALCSAAGP